MKTTAMQGANMRNMAISYVALGGEQIVQPCIVINADRCSHEKRLLEAILDRDNMNAAYLKVKQNAGAPGVDKMTVGALLPYLKEHGEKLLEKLYRGRYKPSPVRRKEIPKENGKMRQLGIPTAVDRMVQQAIAQVLTPIFEPQFVETSYGFRPGRSAHDALRKCIDYLNDGYVWTVDMDLEKFFDTVNHSKLAQVLSKTIKDGRVISLIHKYLNAGVMKDGRFERTEDGVPQGGPLSPLCANILLNELDHELERRGHKFVRYADDMVIFCRSKASAMQTLEHIVPYIEGKLFLKVNREKTVVSHAEGIKFLGYGFHQRKDETFFRLVVHPKSIAKLRAKVKELTVRNKPRTKEEWQKELRLFIHGWVNYFKLADMKTCLRGIDEWMRRRIRMVFLKRWKRVRTKLRNLQRIGLSVEEAKAVAFCRKGLWRVKRRMLRNRRVPDGTHGGVRGRWVN